MTLNIAALTEAWQAVDALAHSAVAPIETTAALKAILQEIGERPGHPLDSLARSLLARVTAYEAGHFPVPNVDGAAMLEFLLDRRGLTQQLVGATGGGITSNGLAAPARHPVPARGPRQTWPNRPARRAPSNNPLSSGR